MSITESIFYFSILVIVYAYFGYPFLLWLISLFYSQPVNEMPYDAKISNIAVIVSISNEELPVIEKKLLNTHRLAYSRNHLEIILALDGTSAEQGDSIMSLISQHQLNRTTQWKARHSAISVGKEKMQQLAMEMAKEETDVFVFTDVASEVSEDSLYFLTEHLNSEIGVVDGAAHVRDTKNITENSKEGLYLRYENLIRELESNAAGIVTAGGCLFAVSKVVAEKMFRDHAQSDFGSVLAAQTLGLKAIIDERARALFDDIKDRTKEFNRKKRTALRGMNTLKAFKEVLNPFQYGLFSFQLVSHKILKWLVPWFMLLTFLSSFFLPNTWINNTFFVLQFLFYLGAIRTQTGKFFMLSNGALFAASIDFLKGKTMDRWTATVR